jgi:hypothetical protein
MSSREHRIRAEATALWRELYNEPPPRRINAHKLLEMMLKRLPEASYERLNSRHLNGRQLTWPKRS